LAEKKPVSEMAKNKNVILQHPAWGGREEKGAAENEKPLLSCWKVLSHKREEPRTGSVEFLVEGESQYKNYTAGEGTTPSLSSCS